MEKMMKKTSKWILGVLFLLTVLLCSKTVPVYAETEGDWRYSVSNGEATILSGSSASGDVVIPATLGGYPVVGIGGAAFFKNSGITSLTFAGDVRSIGSMAFRSNSALTSVTFKGDVESIGEQVFWDCDALKSVIFEGDVESIGEYAFYSCDALPSVKFEGKVGNIGWQAFYNDKALTSVEFEGKVGNIGKEAFRACYALTSLTFKGDVESIGEMAFRSNSALTSVTFKGDVESIGEMAFTSCKALKNVAFCGEIENIFKDAFTHCEHVYLYGTKEQWNSIKEGFAKTPTVHYMHLVTLDANPADADVGFFEVEGYTYKIDSSTYLFESGAYAKLWAKNEAYPLHPFINWTESGTRICTVPWYYFYVYDNRELTANFGEIVLDDIPDLIYDGAEHRPAVTAWDISLISEENYTVKYQKKNAENWIDVETVKDLGDYRAVATCNDDADVLYPGAIGTYEFSVIKRPVTFTGESGDMTYTGSDVTLNGVSVGSGENEGLLPGHTSNVTYSAKGTNVGEYTGTITKENRVRIMSGDIDVTKYYDITTIPGTLTITPKAVTVTAKSKEFTYNGTAQSESGFNVDGLVAGDAISAVVEGTITFPGEEKANVVKSYIFTKGRSYNYEVTTENGKLTMQKATQKITITAASASKTYDGFPLSNELVTVSSGTLFEGDRLVAQATGSVTNVLDTPTGNNKIAKGYKIMHGDKDVSENYNITTIAGTLTIEPKGVTIKARDKAFIYDGTAQSFPEYEVTGLVGDDEIMAVVEGSITSPDEGRVANVVKSYEFTTGTPENYSITTKNGWLTITKTISPITITAGSASKVYDGEPLTNDTVTVTSGNLYVGDRLVAKAAGSVITVSENAIGNNSVAEGYKIMREDKDVSDDYDITIAAGTLTVKPKEVTITAASKRFTYDGTEQGDNGYFISGLVGDDEIYAEVEGSITFPEEGTVANVISSYAFTEGSPENYKIIIKNGRLTMTKAARSITITAADASKTYDGEALTNDAVTITEGSLFTGDKLVASASGCVTSVSENSADNNLVAEGYAIMHGDKDVSESYVITPVAGTLSIMPKDVTITAKDKEFTYTGEAQSEPGYDVEGLVGEDLIEAVVEGSITNPEEGPVANVVTSYAFTTGSPDNYTVKTQSGSLTMKPAESQGGENGNQEGGNTVSENGTQETGKDTKPGTGEQITRKEANVLSVKAKKKTVKVKASKLKKKAQAIKAASLYKFTDKDKTFGTLTYSLTSVKRGSKKVKKGITVEKGSGKIKIKKGLKKGSYKVTIKVTAAGDEKHEAISKDVAITIKVK